MLNRSSVVPNSSLTAPSNDVAMAAERRVWRDLFLGAGAVLVGGSSFVLKTGFYEHAASNGSLLAGLGAGAVSAAAVFGYAGLRLATAGDETSVPADVNREAQESLRPQEALTQGICHHRTCG